MFSAKNKKRKINLKKYKKAIDKYKSIVYNRKAVAGVAESADAHV